MMELRLLERSTGVRIYCITVQCTATPTTHPGEDLYHVDLPALVLAAAVALLVFRCLARESRRSHAVAAAVSCGLAVLAACTALRGQAIARSRLSELGGGDPSELQCSAGASECLTWASATKTDGFGEQLFAHLSGYAHCERCRCTYQHSNMTRMVLFGRFRSDMAGQVARSNDAVSKLFSSLRTWAPLADGVPMAQQGRLQPTLTQHRQRATCTRVVRLSYDGIMQLERANSLHISCLFHSQLSAQLRSAWPVPAPRFFHRSSAVTNIAVHVRRGDVDVSQPRGHRFGVQSDAQVQSCLERVLREQPPGQARHIHVFSWIARPDVRLGGRENVTFHVDNRTSAASNTLATFSAFVHADVLVVGLSTFSFAAGLFHDTTRTRVYVPRRQLVNGEGRAAPRQWRDC